MRNVAFFLTPKHELAFLNKDANIRQSIEKLENYNNYLEIIVIDDQGRFNGILSAKDVLMAFKKEPKLTYENSHQYKIRDYYLEHNVVTVNIDTMANVLVDISKSQNIIPVVDGENRFIGIVRRANLLEYYYKEARTDNNE